MRPDHEGSDDAGEEPEIVYGSCWKLSATGCLMSAWSIAAGNLLILNEQRDVDCNTEIPRETVSSSTMCSHLPQRNLVPQCDCIECTLSLFTQATMEISSLFNNIDLSLVVENTV